MNHNLFTNALAQNVIDGEVNYAGLWASASLKQYWQEIAETPPSSFATDSQRLAFYINAYNALIIRGVLSGQTTESFLHRVRFFYFYWHRIAGKRINLYNLEHKIIRQFRDPRIHFALVCSAKSCPKLFSTAYTAEKLDSQLHENTVDFLNDRQKNYFDLENKTAHISAIFKWFAKDFSQYSSLQSYLAQFVKDKVASDWLNNNEFRICFNQYDWNLNGAI